MQNYPFLLTVKNVLKTSINMLKKCKQLLSIFIGLYLYSKIIFSMEK